jgi:DNA polymerase-3 subunit alpha
MPAEFVHLNVHTEYSLVDGIVRMPALMEKLAGMSMPAVALTDHANLFGMVKFYRAAEQAGIKPLIGSDVWVEGVNAAQPGRMTLLCQDETGYGNLSQLVTRGYLEGQQRGQAVIRREWMETHSAGLIALSGGFDGEPGRLLHSGHEALAGDTAVYWEKLFPQRFYLELSRTGHSGEEACVEGAATLAARRGLPVVASNRVRFLEAADFEAHEARVCIHQGRLLADPHRERRYTEAQYLKSADEMAELFSDLPEALENTVEIAKRCNLSLRLGENFLPDFPTPEDKNVSVYLREQAQDGLVSRLGEADAGIARQDYDSRLAHELSVIESMGFPGYFLIVADFIRWARKNGVPVGPGRGSGAGSLVAYALGITDLDPLKHDLLFERFLNPERVSMPDFDIDFCMEGRDRVIEYVAGRYGRDRVSQIITYGTMAARAVVRDVGRVLGHPYSFVDRVAKQVPFALDMTLDKALEESPELRASYDEDETIHYLIDTARSLEGLVRNAGKHAGGVVISPAPLTEFTPLYCEPDGDSLVTQFDKDDVEAVGLVKFDFLGLRTLTIIDRAVKSINARLADSAEEPLDMLTIPMDDAATFRLLKAGETVAVFQLESAGLRKLIKEIKPDSFEDIVALVALYRPGPLQSGMVVDFINRKHGKAKVAYPHPDLAPILKPTYGIILYQEQVMQIAQVLAGYSLGGADLLRRAMGKKKPEIMAKERSTFLAGALARGVDESKARYIFELIEKFAGYGFNKSHSAAYALLSYQTAWLKTHYPADFMCAVLSSDMDHTDKVVAMIDECQRMGIRVLPPDVNHSGYDFSVVDGETVRYGLGAIKGVGHGAIEGMLRERADSGVYRNLHDFCRRADTRKANRRVMEALICAGALDALGPNRASLDNALADALARAEQGGAAAAAGQGDMFGLVPEAEAGPDDEVALNTIAAWPDDQRLRAEKDTLGLYLTGHPIDAYIGELSRLTNGRIAALIREAGEAGAVEGNGKNAQVKTLAGLLVDLKIRAGKRAILTLDDRSARLECILFEDKLAEFRHLLQKDSLLIVRGRLSYDDYSDGYRVSARELMDLEQARARYGERIFIQWPGHGTGDTTALEACLAPYRGDEGCPVTVRYHNEKARADLHLDEHWRVRICEGLLGGLNELLGSHSVQVRYRRSAQ